MNMQSAVMKRYSKGAETTQAVLCCPVGYNEKLLEILPREILEKDYGCGDPSRYVRPGDTVLDLGSGGGKVCYIAAQLVGEGGRVIGVDLNDEMLALACRYQPEMANRLGEDRVRFVKGYIQNLALDIEARDQYLIDNPIRNGNDLLKFKAWQSEQCARSPLIPDQSVDLVISNCVLNLVNDEEKTTLIQEIFRVLKPGGRVAVSDIVSDEVVPKYLKQYPDLWSGCISGAFQEKAFLQAFTKVGFLGVAYDKWESTPWQIVDNIEFRSVTLVAVKAEDKSCMDYGHAVIYRGPYQSVTDDEGHVFPRGERMAVCERSYKLLTEGPYKEDFIGITSAEARVPVPYCAPPGTRRLASETKGAIHTKDCCGPSCC